MIQAAVGDVVAGLLREEEGQQLPRAPAGAAAANELIERTDGRLLSCGPCLNRLRQRSLCTSPPP